MSPRLEKEESATTNATSPPGSDAAWMAVAAPYDQPMSPSFERGSPVRARAIRPRGAGRPARGRRSSGSRGRCRRVRARRRAGGRSRAARRSASPPGPRALLPPKPWSITVAHPASRGLSKYQAARFTPSPGSSRSRVPAGRSRRSRPGPSAVNCWATSFSEKSHETAPYPSTTSSDGDQRARSRSTTNRRRTDATLLEPAAGAGRPARRPAGASRTSARPAPRGRTG